MYLMLNLLLQLASAVRQRLLYLLLNTLRGFHHLRYKNQIKKNNSKKQQHSRYLLSLSQLCILGIGCWVKINNETNYFKTNMNTIIKKHYLIKLIQILIGISFPGKEREKYFSSKK